MPLLSLFPIFGLSFFIFFVFNKRFSFSLFISITALIFFSSFFATVGFLKFGVELLYIVGTGLFIYYTNKKFIQIIQIAKKPTFFIFTISIFLYWFIFNGSSFLWLDEFTQWGFAYKEMMDTNSLYDANSFIMHPYYPPASPVWQYFISYFGGFNEATTYLAHFLIIASVLNMMYENISFKQFHLILLVFLIQILCLSNFAHGLNSIYVDHIISILFIGVIFSVLLDKYDTKSLWLFLFPLATLYLIKDLGLYFAVGAIGFMGLRVLLDYDNKKKAFISLFILLLLLGLIYKGWNYRLNIIEISDTKQSLSTVVKDIFNNKAIKLNDKDKEIKSRFLEIFFNQQISKSELSQKFYEFDYFQMPFYKDKYKLTTFSIILLYMFIILVAYFIYRKTIYKKYVALYALYMLFIGLIYILIVYLSYFVAFDKQAFKIPSYIRYIHIAIFPMILFAFSIFLPLFQHNKKIINLKIFIIPIFILAYLYIFETPVINKLYKPNIKNNFRTDAQDEVDKIINLSKSNDKIFVVFPVKDNGGMAIQLRYMLYPLKATISSNDIVNYSSKNILNTFSKYDYIWFPIKNQKIYKYYSKLLNSKIIYSVYKVEINDKNMQLKPIL